MFSDPNLCQERMKRLVHRFLQDHQLPGDISAGIYVFRDLADTIRFEESEVAEFSITRLVYLSY